MNKILQLIKPTRRMGRWEQSWVELRKYMNEATKTPHVLALIELMDDIEKRHESDGEVVDNRWIYQHFKVTKAQLYYHTVVTKNLKFADVLLGKRVYLVEDVEAWARRYSIEDLDLAKWMVEEKVKR